MLFSQVAQRAAQLQEALLHCGRFQDALESLLSWLIDTEDLVANQKPPSAEFKVVKAQIQEQKVSEMVSESLSFRWINENKFPVFGKAQCLFKCIILHWGVLRCLKKPSVQNSGLCPGLGELLIFLDIRQSDAVQSELWLGLLTLSGKHVKDSLEKEKA